MLLADLKPYLTMRWNASGGGGHMVCWYHRLFWEAADDYFLRDTKERRYRHARAAGSTEPRNWYYRKSIARAQTAVTPAILRLPQFAAALVKHKCAAAITARKREVPNEPESWPRDVAAH